MLPSPSAGFQARRAARRAALAILTLGSTLTCSDDRFGPGRSVRASFDVADLFEATEAFEIPVDTIRVELRRVSDSSVAVVREFGEGTPGLSVGEDSAAITIEVPLNTSPEDFHLYVHARGAGTVWYEVRARVTVSAGSTQRPPAFVAEYVGPGLSATAVVLSFADTTLFGRDSLRLTATVFEGQNILTGVPVEYLSSDTLKARPRDETLNTAWLDAPFGLDDSVVITARTPTLLTSSARFRFYPRAAQLIKVSGDGQTLLPGQPAAVPLVVRVMNEAGQRYRAGYPVQFAASGPVGTIVNPTTVTSDTAGFAQTVLVAGGAVGGVTVQATAANLQGSPAVFNATVAATGGPALVIIADGDAQTATVGSAVLTNPAVFVTDALGSPVPDVQVTFAVASGGGSVTGATPLSDVNGVATVGSWTLGQTAGTNSLTATVTGLPPVTFIATGAPGAAASLVIISGDGQTADAGTTLPAPLIIEARDQFANAVPDVSIDWTPSDGSLTATSTPTNAAGRAQTTWTLGTNAQTQTVTAAAPGVQPQTFTATAVFTSPSILLALQGANRVGVGRTADLGVTLSQPAPAGGVTVNVTSDNTGILSVNAPGSVSIAQGATSGQVQVTGVAEGVTTVRATASGYTDGAVDVTVSLQVLSLPTTLNVPFAGTASIPIQISTVAPAGGTLVTLVSSDVTRVEVLTPAVTIAEGLQTANGTLSGVLPGSATVTASATGFGTAQSSVSTTASLNVVQSSVTIDASFGTSVTVRLESAGAPIAAPAPGIVVTLTPGNPSCVSAPATVTIPTGLVDVTAPLTYGGAATLPCTTTVTASAADIISDFVNVTVNPAPPINLTAATVGSGLQLPTSGSLGASQHGGVTVRITSSNPAAALVSPNATTSGTAFIDIAVANGTTFFSYYVQGMEGQTGSSSITASSPGFTDRTVTATVVQPALDILFLNASTTTLTPSDAFQVRVGIPNSPTPSFIVDEQAIRAGGTPVTATLTSNQPAIGQLVTTAQSGGTVTVGIAAGQARSPTSVATGGVEFDPLTAGTTTVTATIPGFVVLPSATVAVTVTAPTITLSAATVGSGLQEPTSGSLGASQHGGVTVRVTSSNPAATLVSPDATTAGTTFIDIPVADGTTFFSYYVQGVEGQTGSANITASAPGFTDRTVTATVVQPALDVLFLTASTTTLSPNDAFQVRVGIPNSPTAPSFMSAEQAIRAGGTAVTATLTSDQPAVGQLITTAQSGGTVTVGIAIGQARSPTTVATGGVEFDPLTAGTTTVTGTIAGFIALPSATVAVTVTAPVINLTATTVGSGLQLPTSGSLGATQHGGVTVRITSANPSMALVSPNVTTAGTAFIDIPVANGSTFFSYYVQGVEGQTGSANITASAPGFTDRTVTATVVQPALDILFLNASTTTLSPNDPFQVRVGIPNSPTAPSFISDEQAVRAGGTALTATIRSSLANVGQLITSTQTGGTVTVGIAAGQARSPSTVATGGVEFDPLTAGPTTVVASIPGFIALPSASVAVTVTAPGITLSATTVGAGLQIPTAGNLGASQHGGVVVRIASSNPTVALVSPNISTPGTAFIDITIPNGSTGFSYYVQGVEAQTGVPAITATASGFTDGTTTTTVVQPALDIIFLSTSIGATAANNPFQVRVGIPNAGASPSFIADEQSIRAGGAAVTATIRSSVPAVGQLVTTAQTGGSVTVLIAVGQARSPSTLAAGGVEFDPLSVGGTTVSASIPAFIALPSASVSVTVTP